MGQAPPSWVEKLKLPLGYYPPPPHSEINWVSQTWDLAPLSTTNQPGKWTRKSPHSYRVYTEPYSFLVHPEKESNSVLLFNGQKITLENTRGFYFQWDISCYRFFWMIKGTMSQDFHLSLKQPIGAQIDMLKFFQSSLRFRREICIKSLIFYSAVSLTHGVKILATVYCTVDKQLYPNWYFLNSSVAMFSHLLYFLSI